MSRPNILLICTDQQRFDALGAAGNAAIDTPNLDRLATQGVRFDRCFVQSPVCAPSRASLMTSKYPRNHGLWANGVDIAPTERLFTAALAEDGYDCGLVGKFHLGAAFGGRTEPRIDDGFRVFRWAHDPYVRNPENHYHSWLEEHHPGLLDETLAQGSDAMDRLPTEAHYSRWIGEEAIRYLREDRDVDKPFCFIVNFFDPHHGFGAPAEFRDRYDPSALPTPIGGPDDLDDKPAIYREASAKSYAGTLPGFEDYSPDEIQDIVREYYAMVSLVDAETGRILDALEAEGLADDTIVVFTSDHGELLGDHRMLLKGPMMFDCSVRVPLIVRWPGELPAGEVRDDIVQWIDLAPTLLDAAGTAPLPAAQGTSLLGLARTGDWPEARGWALTEYRNSCIPYEVPVHTTMLRTDDWKVVVHHGGDRQRTGELYSLRDDPRECTNLWDHPEARERRLDMQEELLDVLVATEDRSNPRLANF